MALIWFLWTIWFFRLFH